MELYTLVELKMTKLVLTIGLPASGKSTYAREFVLSAGGNWKIVCKDDLRAMLDAGKWSPRNEKIMQALQKDMAKTLLSLGYSVIVADTNLSPKVQEAWKQLAKEKGANFERKSFLDVPVEECIKRDLKRSASVGKDVIMDMYNKFIKPTLPQKKQYIADENLPKALILDLDGTIAIKTGGRGWYDWHRVGEDEVDMNVAFMVDSYKLRGYKVIAVSGRDGVCKAETEEWLERYQIGNDELFMREPNDMRKDTIIKEEIFWRDIAPKYNVKFCIDDRDCVVEMFRSIGLKVYQVASGNF
jgi:predicted kinase